MSQANKLGHEARNLDVKEVCENSNDDKTLDKMPIRKILVGNIDPSTSYKLLRKTFEKFGMIVQCVLKKQRQFEKPEVKPAPAVNPPAEVNPAPVVNQEEDESRIIVKSYAFITYYTVAEAKSALQAGSKRQISIKKQYLRVVPANFWNQPDNPDAYDKCCYVCKHQAAEIDLNATLSPSIYYRVEDGALISRLNNDCLRHIFNFLPFIDRVRVERVSQRWRAVSLEAWHDQHKLDFNPINWGSKSTKQRDLTNPDACAVYKVLKKCCPFIIQIDLSKFSNQLGNSILIELADMCSLIEYINLENFPFRHTGIRALAANCLSLKEITLGYTESPYKFDSELSKLFMKSQNLKKLKIDCFIIEGNCLYHLPKQTMQELILKNANYVLRNGIYKFLGKTRNLRVLKIIGIPGSFRRYGDFIKCIGSCSKLEILEIPTKRRSDSNYLRSDILEPLTGLTNLTKIDLKGNCALDDNFLKLLSGKCRNLTSVDISDCPYITDTGLEGITSLPKLEYLCVDALINVTDYVFRKRMPCIKTLLCSGCTNLHSFGLSMLVEAANKLEILDLTDCTYVSNDFVINAIRRCKRTRWRCLKMYLKGTNAVIDGINFRFHWDYLRLFVIEREDEDLFYY